MSEAVVKDNQKPVLHALKLACSNCSLAELCLPFGLPDADLSQLDLLIDQRRSVRRGEHLYQAGTHFESLYAIRRGFFKTHALTEDGREQVTGFHMTGEIMGVDAISTDIHACHATALEDSEVCEIPFTRLENLIREIPALQRQFHRIMSREIVRDQSVMMLLGNMRAEERVAAFLLNLSQRNAARGYSASGFHLRMTREEIGSFMGLKLETVSRTFSKLQDEGYITVDKKRVDIIDMERLKALLSHCSPRNVL
ncbi:fumarate/nitrate reduction transcriptional regulator Fnr [Allohahella marinimesophila]|uniref:Fumarate/nitrate reduction transcriptional regulator Fnr n=1 Tax=Allohahella marinimesophila TaxID=1054972 RepID=A0ABP7P1E0_9GAMM